MNISKHDFGTFEESQVHHFHLENDNGITVKISDYGAMITSIKVPNSEGEIEEITCGFDQFESYFSDSYKSNAPYFGGTVGRYCSQIKDAKFDLNGTTYELAANCGPNNLHGGGIGFDKKPWSATTIEKADEVALILACTSPHLEEGFPGNVNIKVKFTLTNSNKLQIDYEAKSDADTPFSTTNHTYFNLSGFASSIEGHTVQISSHKKQVWDDSGAATGEVVSVINKADDLQTPKLIGEVHEAMGDGFEHYYIFEEKDFALDKVAEIHCPDSGRTLEVSTTEPGMLFYTGKYTSDELKRESGQQYGKYRGFCCETHRYPNGPNIDSPKSILRAGEQFKSTTIFTFKW